MSILNQLPATNTKTNKRLGRGYGSGKGGHTVGRGQKGAGARKSSQMPLYFEGGQLPLTKRLPMIRGKSRFQSFGKIAEINLSDLNKVNADKITLETLKLHGLADQAARGAKVVATGKIEQAIHIEGLRVSDGAKKMIEAAGGSVS